MNRHWRDWRALESIGEIEFMNAWPDFHSSLLKLAGEFRVAPEAFWNWIEKTDIATKQGKVCICGHPENTHSPGGLCEVGPNICTCNEPWWALLVSDLRCFYQYTKGPHEAHALVRGCETLARWAGKSDLLIDWRCSKSECFSRAIVGPVRRTKGGALSRGLGVSDKHQLLCERCLIAELNGGLKPKLEDF